MPRAGQQSARGSRRSGPSVAGLLASPRSDRGWTLVGSAFLLVACNGETETQAEPRKCEGPWADVYGAEGDQRAGALAMHANGDVTLIGTFEHTLDLGSGPLQANPWSRFVARYDACGQPLWSVARGDAIYLGMAAAADDGSGNVAMVDLLPSGELAIVALDATGAELWNAPLGDSTVEVLDMATAGGGVVAVGRFGYSFTASSEPVDNPGNSGAFVVRVDEGGAVAFASTFVGESNDDDVELSGVAVAADGSIVSSGTAQMGAVDLGEGPLARVGGRDLLLLRLDDRGDTIWSKRLGGTGLASGGPVAIDGDGRIVVGGELYTGNLSLGTQSIDVADGGFLATFDQGGDALASQAAPQVRMSRIRVTSSGAAMLVGGARPTSPQPALIGETELEDLSFVALLDANLDVTMLRYVHSAEPTGAAPAPDGGMFLAGNSYSSWSSPAVDGVRLRPVDDFDPFLARLPP